MCRQFSLQVNFGPRFKKFRHDYIGLFLLIVELLICCKSILKHRTSKTMTGWIRLQASCQTCRKTSKLSMQLGLGNLYGAATPQMLLTASNISELLMIGLWSQARWKYKIPYDLGWRGLIDRWRFSLPTIASSQHQGSRF